MIFTSNEIPFSAASLLANGEAYTLSPGFEGGAATGGGSGAGCELCCIVGDSGAFGGDDAAGFAGSVST